MRVDDPNLPILILVADALGDLCEDLVFVGGCAVGLLLTDPATTGIRPTQDVDAIVEAATLSQFYRVEALLPQKGFVRDAESGVICRWKHLASGARFDLMPTDPEVLGFANRWYPEALETATSAPLNERLHINLISAPAFIATKLEAFSSRGNPTFSVTILRTFCASWMGALRLSTSSRAHRSHFDNTSRTLRSAYSHDRISPIPCPA